MAEQVIARPHALHPIPARHAVDCAIVIVTYNSGEDIANLLRSIPAAVGQVTHRAVVVDNASSDDTAEQVSQCADVDWVPLATNVGYSAAINVGRRVARPYRSLLVLNADVVLTVGSVAVLHRALDETGAGVVVPRMLDGDGTVYPSIRRTPTITRAFGDALFGGYLKRRPSWLTHMVWDEGAYHTLHAIDWATGSAMLVAGACDREVGAWDADRFFLYSEEVDYAIRARARGFAFVFVPAAEVTHRGGGSGTSIELQSLMAVNRIRVYEKHNSRNRTRIYRVIAVIHEALRAWKPAHRSALWRVLRRSRWSYGVGAEAGSGT